MKIPGAAAECRRQREGYERHQKAAADDRGEHEQQNRSKREPGKAAIEQADDAARQQECAGHRAGRAEQAPTFAGAERYRKPDQDKSDADYGTRRKRRIERQDAGGDRDRAKRHQNVDRQGAEVARGERLQLFGLSRCELAIPHQPRDIENDFDGLMPRSNRVEYRGLMLARVAWAEKT